MSTDDILIFSYSRKEAIGDGVLIDVTDAAWAAAVEIPEGVLSQDEGGRLWDVLTMLRHACRGRSGEGSTLFFDVLVMNDAGGPKPVRLKAVCGPDDDLTPCLTVMLPDED